MVWDGNDRSWMLGRLRLGMGDEADAYCEGCNRDDTHDPPQGFAVHESSPFLDSWPGRGNEKRCLLTPLRSDLRPHSVLQQESSNGKAQHCGFAVKCRPLSRKPG